jgi:hypothetical protein
VAEVEVELRFWTRWSRWIWRWRSRYVQDLQIHQVEQERQEQLIQVVEEVDQEE